MAYHIHCMYVSMLNKELELEISIHLLDPTLRKNGQKHVRQFPNGTLLSGLYQS